MKNHSDTAVLGVITALVGGTAYQVFVWFFYLLGIAKITPFQIGAYIFIRPGLDFTSLPAQLLGMVQHYSLSTILAFITSYCLQKIGTDYLLLKGLLLGITIYFLFFGVLAKFVVPVEILQPDFATSVVYLFGNLVFGIAASQVLSRLAKR